MVHRYSASIELLSTREAAKHEKSAREAQSEAECFSSFLSALSNVPSAQ